MNHPRRQLGRILLEQGTITREQLQTALEYRRRKNCKLQDALLALDLCGELEIGRALAEQNGLSFIDFNQTPPSPQAVQLVPREVAVEYGVVPARLEGNRLVVAALNPYDLRLDGALNRVAGMPVLVAGAAASQIRDLLGRYDQLKWSKQPRTPAAPVFNTLGSPPMTPATSSPYGTMGVASAPVPPGIRRGSSSAAPIPAELMAASEQPQVVQKVNALLADAVRRCASELFLQMDPEGLAIRCRIFSRTHPLARFPRPFADALLARAKIIGGLNQVTQAEVRTGTGHVRIDGAGVELRSTLLPGAAGEILALRLLLPEPDVRSLEELGMDAGAYAGLRRVVDRRRGLVLVAGGVGAGRPTTLYALVKALQEAGAHVLTLEGTVERKLAGYHQVLLGDGTARSFASAMQVCLEQGPDALMVGELPDRAAADLACRAGATGQVVLAGSHAPDAAGALARLMDLGVSPQEAAAGLAAVVAQRLLPRVCEKCARPSPIPFPLERALRGVFAFPESVRFRKGRGCPECYDLGSRGCVGVFEVLVADDDLRRLIADRVPPSVLEAHLRERGFRSLEEDAFHKAAAGLIPSEELSHLDFGLPPSLTSPPPPVETGPSADDWDPELFARQEIPVLESWEDVAAMALTLGESADEAGGDPDGASDERWASATDAWQPDAPAAELARG